jgi:hypothetical protein
MSKHGTLTLVLFQVAVSGECNDETGGETENGQSCVSSNISGMR